MIFSKEQKRVLVKTGTVVLALFLIFICYSYVIPRTEVEIDTVYHSSYSALFVQFHWVLNPVSLRVRILC